MASGLVFSGTSRKGTHASALLVCLPPECFSVSVLVGDLRDFFQGKLWQYEIFLMVSQLYNLSPFPSP